VIAREGKRSENGRSQARVTMEGISSNTFKQKHAVKGESKTKRSTEMKKDIKQKKNRGVLKTLENRGL